MQKELIEGFRLSPQQEQLWTWQQGIPTSALKCRAAVQIKGPLDKSRLISALNTLVARHEILRTAFDLLAGMTVPLQIIQEGGQARLRELDWSGLDDETCLLYTSPSPRD